MTDPLSPLDVTIEGAVAVLTMTRSARRNAMDQALVDAMKATLLRLDRDDAVAAIVLNGCAPGFCAGSDLKFISALDTEAMCRFEQECGDLGRLIGHISKPVVAAVETFAIGGGFTLAACCDVVVAGRGSSWSMPEVPHGWLTPWGLGPLVARVGPVRARNLCFCLKPLTGEEAAAIALVDICCADGEALATAREIAAQLARLPAPAVAATKRFFSSHFTGSGEALDFEANRLFRDNCREAAAQATFGKFRNRAGARP
ncbi:MAG: enoyl-CoA hydratase [Azorhizobium sp. 39-67-5]|jgi:enoyl-CoA hydratase/carnithine racemase|nr:MAG: enoyl-CoA hydratase [Azorhizobium sp. 39-67-5]